MKRCIDVHTGEVMAGQGHVVLKSDTKGACLVIVAYDAINQIGALGHAMLGSNKSGKHPFSSRLRDVAGALDEMFEDMTLLGADRNNIEISLVSGENINSKEDSCDYNQDIASTIDLLEKKHIRYNHNMDNEESHSQISLDVESGNILYV